AARRRGRPLRSARIRTEATGANAVWTGDYKGQFRTGDGRLCYPLTVVDSFSRFVLVIHGLPSVAGDLAWSVFERAFRQYGLPEVLRTDNGSPFASSRALAGLSWRAVPWLRLGMRGERNEPAHPEQNGAHEQMHRVLKAETTRPVSSNLRAQQRRIARWLRTYNRCRPHQGLQQRVPAEKYCAKPGPVRRVGLRYPRGCTTRRVRSNGQIKWRGRKRFVGEAFVGYTVGLKSRRGEKWEVYFGGLLIGELWASDQGGIRPATHRRRH